LTKETQKTGRGGIMLRLTKYVFKYWHLILVAIALDPLRGDRRPIAGRPMQPHDRPAGVFLFALFISLS